MTTLTNDIKYGLRQLFKSPAFSTVAVFILVLGIGANTAIFTLMEAMLFKSLPVDDPQQLVVVTWHHPTYGQYSSFSYPLYCRWSDSNQSFSGLFATTGISKVSMTVDGSEPIRVGLRGVSGNFHDVLGVPAVLGRALTPDDDRPGSSQAIAVISHAFWQSRFGLDPGVVGKIIRLEDTLVTIIGVTPRAFSGFELGTGPDLWMPMQMTPRVEGPGRARALTSESSQWLRIVGRLKPGVDVEQARAELDVGYQQIVTQQATRLARRMSEKEMLEFRRQRIELEKGHAGYSTLRWEFRRPLLILMAIAGLVLLVACANLGGLLLVRGAARRREFSVRAALGANRSTLIRQLATESLLLAMIGGVLGLLVARWGAGLLAHFIPGYGRTVIFDLALDFRILVFTFVVSCFTGVLFGIIPAWRGTRIDLATSLKDPSGTAGRTSRQYWHKILVVSQISVSCCLLIGAGLFVRTVQKLRSLDIGIERDKLLSFQLDLGKGYDDTRRAELYRGVLARLGDLPGIQRVCSSSIQSLGGSEIGWGPNQVRRPESDLNLDEALRVRGTGVTLGYFETMGIPLLQGRDFGPQDERMVSDVPTNQAPHPLIIDETVARKLFGQQNPIGELLVTGSPGPPRKVIGVAKNVIHKGIRSGPRTSVYSLAPVDRLHALNYFHVRTAGSTPAVAGNIRQVMRTLDPQVEVKRLQTMNNLINNQIFRERSLSSFAGFFSLLALVLACLGLYGTLSYTVVQRTREIGVRMALGARRQDVVSFIGAQGLKLVLLGIAVGLGTALVLTRLVSSLLYGISAIDTVTFGGVSILLVGVSVIACWLPARRATRIDPMEALRYE